VIAAARRGGARFSVTARMDPAVTRAITTISDDAWVTIKYPNAIWDDEQQRWISDAAVAEVPFTAFTSRTKGEHVTGRLIVRRVRRLNPATARAGQGELFATWRHHAVFTDTALTMLAAEASHRGHAIIENVIADLKDGALAHMPSGKFTANAAWTVLAAIAYNLTRAAGVLASAFHAKATTATIRTQLIAVPARIARSARRSCLHLPAHWPWQDPRTALHAAATGPPPPRRPDHPAGDGATKDPSGRTGQAGDTLTPDSRTNAPQPDQHDREYRTTDPGSVSGITDGEHGVRPLPAHP